MPTILITGATGYIGRHLVKRLVEEGVRPRCLVRPGSRLDGLPVAHMEIVRGDITDPASLPAAVLGMETIVHLASVVSNVKESKTVQYMRINAQGTANLARAAKESGVGHFVHMGGLNTVPGAPDSYIRTRYEGEQAVKNSGIPYTILQPSILFGDGAAFFTALADLARVAPIVPVPGNGRLRFQPVWVEDVITCSTMVLKEGGRNETIPLGGTQFYTYDALLDLIFKTLRKRRYKLHMPMLVMQLSTAAMQAVLPKPPATTATMELFSTGTDNVTTLDAIPKRFGFQPKSLVQDLEEHGI